MKKKEIIRLAIKYLMDDVNDKESVTILNLSPEEMDVFCKVVKALSAKRA